MGQNTAVKHFELEDFLFSESEIHSDDISRENLFEIKKHDENIGYISLDGLKKLHEQDNYDWNEFTFRKFGNEEWTNLYEIHPFQRRKPQLVSTETVIENDITEIHLLLKGQKSGPFTKSDLKKMLDHKEILYTDLISINGGQNWAKLYSLDGFNRRNLSEYETLPTLPDKEVLNNQNTTQTKTVNLEVMDAITGLAYLGNIKKGKAVELQNRETPIDTVQTSPSNFYKYMLLGSVIGIIYFTVSLKNSLKTPFKDGNGDARIGEQSEASSDTVSNELTPNRNGRFNSNINPTNSSNGQNNNRPSSDNFQRMGKFETRRINPPRPARNTSFTNSSKYRNANNNANNGDGSPDQNYYYNDNSPMELDPVGRNISKDTSDPTSMGEPGPAPSTDPLFNQEMDN
jgi:hypothetical protein